MDIVKIIFSNLLYNETFARKTMPYLKEEYFHNKPDNTLFVLIKSFVDKYNTFPSLKSLAIDLSNMEGLSEDSFNQCKEVLFSIKRDEEELSLSWLLDETEKFCKEKALHNAIMESIQIIDNRDTKHSKGMIPQLVIEALAVSFDTSVGHDFFEDAEERYEYYHRVENKIPFRLDFFNKITKGGVSNKTLSIIIAGTGVGKSMMMCGFAADNILLGKNVLYITLEMSEEETARRIDANLLNLTMDEIETVSKDNYMKMIDRLKVKSPGKLIIHEYPTSSASTIHFKHLLHELKLKKNFTPDIIYVDYLGICASARVKLSNQVSSYALIKAVAEELRAMGVEWDVPVVSAVQLNREGFKSSDPGMGDTSESFGVPFTADLMFGLISSDELDSIGQIMVKQMKNRYNDPNRPRKFVIGVDKAKMRLYDLEETAQKRVLDGDDIIKPEATYLTETKFDKKQVFNDFI